MECYEKESWQKETEKRILDVIKGMGIDRMPSLSETKIFTGNTSLGNRIMKSGGFKHWAWMMFGKLYIVGWQNE